MDDSEEKETVAVLRGLHFCPRCVLRFLGRRSINIYSNPLESCPSLWKSDPKPEDDSKERESNDDAGSSELRSEVEETNVTTKDKVCPACLGILQKQCSNEAIGKICADVRSLDYDFKTYMMSLALPLQLDIRHHYFVGYLNEVCKAFLKSGSIIPIKEVFKWVCGPLMSQHFKVSFNPKSHFEVGLTFEHEETKREVELIFDAVTDAEPAKKRQKFWKHSQKNKEVPTKQIIGNALKCLSKTQLKRLLPFPPEVPKIESMYTIECLHEPIYLAGRYTKHSRHLSQTPWVISGERKTESSVEEHICVPIQEKLRAADYRFSSSGREDVDVRTLGRGRPFTVEIINPRKNVLTVEDCKQLQEDINHRTADIGVRDLQVAGRDATLRLKEGETEKRKSYMALVRVASPITAEYLAPLNVTEDLVLQQKTPIRVLHRRPLATRERTIHSMSTEVVDDLHFRLTLCTQAGTYIKEFVHGDLGRTQPNVGALLQTDADILELDVTAVHVDWPPKLDD